MRNWDLTTLAVEPHSPIVVESNDEGRVIVLQLPAGDLLHEHQVHERAWLVVVDGRIAVIDSAGDSVEGGPGFLAAFDPNERREIRAESDSRLLLLLGPWPGVGHPSQRPVA